MLRDYQRNAIDLTWSWLESNKGNPCIELPTASGKSHVVAEMCRELLQQWSGARILVVHPSKELCEQNAEKMRLHWPNAPMGICCAGLNRRDTTQPIIFGTIGTMINCDFGYRTLILVDEAHLIHHKDEGRYRELMNRVKPDRVVGLTATPYRLGHGYIVGDLFADIIRPTSIEELVARDFLCPLRSTKAELQFDLSKVHVRGGEFVKGELEAAVDSASQNREVAAQIAAIGEGRKAWLLFCSGIDHTWHMRDAMRAIGVSCEMVTGNTPKKEREAILGRFKASTTQCVANANVLTTGFDYPGIDLIALLRPTQSTSLHVQMNGRGMRISPDKEYCRILDFAGNIQRCGPITSPIVPEPRGRGTGEAPVKVCEKCNELVHTSVRVCPTCGFEWPVPESSEKDLSLHNDDIMGDGSNEIEIDSWRWCIHKKGEKEMLRVDYYPKDLDRDKVSEWLCVHHDGYAQRKALQTLAAICDGGGFEQPPVDDLLEAIAALQQFRGPANITVDKDGKYWRVKSRSWDRAAEEPLDEVPF